MTKPHIDDDALIRMYWEGTLSESMRGYVEQRMKVDRDFARKCRAFGLGYELTTRDKSDAMRKKIELRPKGYRPHRPKTMRLWILILLLVLLLIIYWLL